MDPTAALTTYGPLGVWVAFSIVRERWLLGKLDEIQKEQVKERVAWNRERMRWLTVLGRKLELSDHTITNVIQDEDY
tara:strand:- start:100 stop:330 length:231 start_codon:yes stop_codon:yes gene_type:complete